MRWCISADNNRQRRASSRLQENEERACGNVRQCAVFPAWLMRKPEEPVVAFISDGSEQLVGSLPLMVQSQ
jgi:hypothetical protein